MNFIDLFAGAGGLSEGFIQAGFKPIAHVEMNQHAAETLKTRNIYHYLNKENKLNIYYKYLSGEIKKKDLYQIVPTEVIDNIINEEMSNKNLSGIFEQINSKLNNIDDQQIKVIIGGPPCQAYSAVGRARDNNNMLNDPRNYLYKLYVRFLKKYEPLYFVFENVPGIKTSKGGKIYKNIKALMKRVGYEVQAKELNANSFGVLQSRKRVIIIGWRKGSNLGYPVFESVHYNATVNELLRDLVPLKPSETINKYIEEPNEYLKLAGIRNENDILTHHIARGHNERDREIYKYAIEKWENYQERLRYTDLPERLCTHQNREAFLDRFKVVSKDLPYSHTMLAHISKDGHHFIHPDIKQLRSLSVREAARIQSFPDNYYFEGPRTANFVQIGNAVPPMMALGIANGIKQMLLKI